MDELVHRLRLAGCVNAEAEAALLVEAAESPTQLAGMVDRRVAGEPLEHVVGWAEFCGLRVAVAPGVFVPRRRTEALVGQAIAVTPPAAVVVDLCCGSGALGLAVARYADVAELHASDIDPVAVASARRNGVPHVYEGDLYDALPHGLRGRVDILLANTPYVPTDAIALMPAEARDHEPRVALDGGGDGLDVQRRVAAGATQWLAPDGHLLVEASEEQAPIAAEILARPGLTPTVVTDDDSTVVLARRELS